MTVYDLGARNEVIITGLIISVSVMFVEITAHVRARSNRIKVQIVALYRSGSTFTSELFSNHPDAFYM